MSAPHNAEVARCCCIRNTRPTGPALCISETWRSIFVGCQDVIRILKCDNLAGCHGDAAISCCRRTGILLSNPADAFSVGLKLSNAYHP